MVNCSCCLRYCKSTIFQANHNKQSNRVREEIVVCDTAKVRFFKQITTPLAFLMCFLCCLRYCKSTIFQANHNYITISFPSLKVVCDTAKVRFFKQITTRIHQLRLKIQLFAILQKYDFSSKSQPNFTKMSAWIVVCDTAKVRFFKQITTDLRLTAPHIKLFAILQKYDFSSKSQRIYALPHPTSSCLRYCKSTIFQANHNVCKKDIQNFMLFAILQKYDFSSKSQRNCYPVP